MMTTMTQPTREFLEVCATLYGGAVDPYAVWEDVTKSSAGQADRKARVRRNVERSSNAIGIAAGSLGLAGSLRDDRLAEGTGRISRVLTSTGRKMPKLAERVGNPKVRAAMAATAVGTQVANLGGDALIAGTLGERPEPRRRAGRTGVAKAWPGPITPAVAGLRRLWNPSVAAAAAPKPGTRAGAKAAQSKAAQAATGAKQRAQGADAAAMLSTTSGKIVTGAGAAGLANSGRKKMARRSLEYVPDEVAYAKGDETVDVEFAGTFSKFDEGKRLAFGWASVTKVNGSPVVDRQGDYIDTDDLEEAVYKYVHSSRVGGDMHKRTQSVQGDAAHKVSDMVESIVFTDEKIAKMGLPDSTPRGWWVGYKIHDDDTWELVKKGERTGFSIHGKGLRKAQDIDELMGAR